MRWLFSFTSITLLAVFAASPCQAQEKYYVMVFGSQQTPPDPRYAHSFAIFVREFCTPAGSQFDYHIISWLAATAVIRVNALLPEAGRNFDIPSTFHWAYSTCQRVSIWGPYEIDCTLYQRSVKEFLLLQNGKVRYKAVDSGYPTNRVSNCIHVLGDVAGGARLRVASPGWGETASYVITQRYRRWFLNPCQKHLWLVKELGLGKYPLIYRDLEAPRSGAIWSLLRTVTGREEKLPGPYILDCGPDAPILVPSP